MKTIQETCPFCGGPITAYQGHMDYTFFTCGDPREKYPKSGCGAVVSFRDGPGGKRGEAAFKMFRARSAGEKA